MLNPNPLSQLTRLRQATACPSLLSSTISESVKLDKLEELVAEIAKMENSVLSLVIGLRFVKLPLNALKNIMPKHIQA